ncbi:MAG TPA: hypothetical protein VK904_05170 [Miltoncostaeaceae bacterium]|nr:hypothetical protein [Miltoncostaeaceae bacterium]
MPDVMDTPSWSEFQAARQRFLDGLAADAALRGVRRRARSGRLMLPALRPAAEERGEPAKAPQGEPAG